MNSNSFQNQITKYQKDIYFYALRLTKNLERAEDLRQDVLLRAIEQEHNYKKDKNLKSWLLLMTKNTFINQLKRETKRTASSLDQEAYDVASDFNSATDTQLKDLRKLIETSSRNFQNGELKCFWLKAQNYQDAEIAKILGLPEGTVKNRVHRVRKNLQKKLPQIFDYGLT